MTDNPFTGAVPKDKLACRCGSFVFFVAIAERRAAALVCVACLYARNLRQE